MPLTPLHLAAALPVRKQISMKAFIAVNLMIDIEPIGIAFFDMPDNLHQFFHTILGATFWALVTWIAGLILMGHWKQVFAGAFFGTYTHVLLDSLVHRDVELFSPIIAGNPLFLDAHLEVSIACAAVLTYYLAKWVESLHIVDRFKSEGK